MPPNTVHPFTIKAPITQQRLLQTRSLKLASVPTCRVSNARAKPIHRGFSLTQAQTSSPSSRVGFALRRSPIGPHPIWYASTSGTPNRKRHHTSHGGMMIILLGEDEMDDGDAAVTRDGTLDRFQIYTTITYFWSRSRFFQGYLTYTTLFYSSCIPTHFPMHARAHARSSGSHVGCRGVEVSKSRAGEIIQ